MLRISHQASLFILLLFIPSIWYPLFCSTFLVAHVFLNSSPSPSTYTMKIYIIINFVSKSKRYDDVMKKEVTCDVYVCHWRFWFAPILVLHLCSCAVCWFWSGCSLNPLALLSYWISIALMSKRLRSYFPLQLFCTYDTEKQVHKDRKKIKVQGEN